MTMVQCKCGWAGNQGALVDKACPSCAAPFCAWPLPMRENVTYKNFFQEAAIHINPLDHEQTK